MTTIGELLFDVAERTAKTEEIKSLVELKYGSPSIKDDYLQRLPTIVLEVVISRLKRIGYRFPKTEYTQEEMCDLLFIVREKDHPILFSIIRDVLVDYHRIV